MIRRAASLRWFALACVVLAACTPERGWIERSSADSEAAERALARGETAQATARLRAIVEREVPDGVAREDARVVKQDALERWARIELARGDEGEALRLVSEGLALGERRDVFTANLLMTRGRIHEVAGRDREAARDYHRALVIEEALLNRALEGDDE